MKTKLKMRKMLSLFITLIMLGTMLPANFAFAEIPNDPNDTDEIKSYIVVTDSDGAFSDVVDIIDDDAITENELLAENNMLVAELTNDEAESIESENGVLFVEEDFLIEANETED